MRISDWSSDVCSSDLIALQDPGVANWMDTAGLHEGWFQIRWQNVSAGGDPTAEPVRLAKLNELMAALPTGVPMADLAYLQVQIRSRVELFSQLASESSPDPLPRFLAFDAGYSFLQVKGLCIRVYL